MKPGTPWRIKGIGADARAAAEEAARQAGTTTASWLSEVIRAASEAENRARPETAEIVVHPSALSREAAIDNLLDDIRRLTREIADSEARALSAIAPLSERVHGLSARIAAVRFAGEADTRPLDEAAERIARRLDELERPSAAPARERGLFDRDDG